MVFFGAGDAERFISKEAELSELRTGLARTIAVGTVGYSCARPDA